MESFKNYVGGFTYKISISSDNQAIYWVNHYNSNRYEVFILVNLIIKSPCQTKMKLLLLVAITISTLKLNLIKESVP